MIGHKVGRLTVREEVAGTGKRRQWLCDCECGGTTVLPRFAIKGAKPTRSCGCLHLEWARTGNQNRRHGGCANNRSTKLYMSWNSMVGRCSNPTHGNYAAYGGRGIRVCERWLAFENFREDMGDRPDALHSLERIDVHGNYELANCRWATATDQANNRRSNHFITAYGRRQTRAQWAREFGVTPATIKSRLDREWSPEDAVSLPIGQRPVFT